MRSVAVFGGTGFLGRAVVDQLVAAGMMVRVAVRHPEPINLSDGTARAEHLSSVYADVADEKSVGRALEGCDAAVNVVGLYVERGTDTFRTVHELGAMHVARQSARAGVKLSSTCPALVPISTHNQATSVPAREASYWSGKLSQRPPSSALASCSGQTTSS